jgi:hypothetical protein
MASSPASPKSDPAPRPRILIHGRDGIGRTSLAGTLRPLFLPIEPELAGEPAPARVRHPARRQPLAT